MKNVSPEKQAQHIAEAALPINHSSPRKFIFQLFCLLNVFAMATILVWPLTSDSHPSSAISILLGAFVGFLIADLVSGLAHWFFDTYGTENTPIIGELFIKQFRIHHDDPLNITRTPFVRINGDNAMAAGGFLLAVVLLTQVGYGPDSGFSIAALVAFGMAITFTNMFHQWSHKANPPALARLLHRFNLVLTPAAHSRHHQAPYRSYYCITLGWMNPLLDGVGFFRKLETVIGWFGPVAFPLLKAAKDDKPPHEEARSIP